MMPDSPATPSAPSTAHQASWLSPVPLFFVLLWSTGFIAARYGLPYAPPLSFLILRCLGAVLILLPVVLLTRAPWPRGRILHVALAGLLLQAGYLGGVWSAIKIGMPAGLSALIVGMQPILTAFAAPLVGERVTPRQWLGLLLGLSGVGLVVYSKLNLDGLAPAAVGLCVLALLSITAGTLYQKRYCPQFDLRTGTVIQFSASALMLLPLAIVFEDFTPALANIHWNIHFAGALLWSILALSIGAIFLLFRLISRNDATRVTSLLYLTPPTTAVMAWLMFGETLGSAGLAGMAVAVAGVAFVVKK
ncbi:DMT family transporter [Herbaspirillum sp. SJZ107]|uniref:DMT family transporter n=1 Tax=Herbaspirillum sp. SJZ107 TaxID=2572881 RepID=UPI00114EC5B2|nr:DMT family transporter [Herbaspirillum sp. SJZ107]TQK07416.1 drug/metabolite transporter (DMT)-like permease [Herbaspirillum sp. SJZ107]